MKSNIDPVIYSIYKSLFPLTLNPNENLANDAEKAIINISRFCSGTKVADTLIHIA